MKKYIAGGVLLTGVLLSFLYGIYAPEFSQPLSNETNTDTSIQLEPQTVTFGDGSGAVFMVPRGFTIAVAREDVGKARFMAMSPDGRLFVPDLVDYLLSPEGSIQILEDFNEHTKQFETKHIYLSNLQGPNSVAFYQDENGQDWIYVATTAQLLRYPYQAGDTRPSGNAEIIATFPTKQTPGETSVVWHITRTIEIHNDRLYISIGSGCNSCEQLEGALRGMILSMNPDGSDVKVYADGLRNAVGLEWAQGALYATENGVDHLGNNAPDERLFRIVEGEHYAWPFCYELNGAILSDITQEWNDPISCDTAPHSFAAFPPRSAPLGVTYFKEAHRLLKDYFLVSLHGSFDVGVESGYELVRVAQDGTQETFMSGFLNEDGERVARPVHVLQYTENGFFLSDDYGGRIFYVSTNES